MTTLFEEMVGINGLGNPWFGESWGAPVCEETPHIDTPVGEKCLYCKEEIEEGDRGFIMPFHSKEAQGLSPVHMECQLRQVVGGLNHLKGTCSCQGGPDEPDPPDMTKREAAVAAYEYFLEQSPLKS